jgi:hypothetical protein
MPVVPGTLVAGAPGEPIAGLAAPLAVVGVPAAAGVVTVLVTALAVELPEPVSDTNAAVSAPREITITAPNAITGERHRGVAARRVRAAAPQRMHHSCSAPSGAPHSGHPSTVGPWVGGDVGVATLTQPRSAGG